MAYDVFISYNTVDRQIAEAVCHYIEDRRLRCFIAPRDITTPDWADSITAAIESAKAFVIVVSEHSNASNEVAKEITLATQVCDYIFPFRVDNTELGGRMTYHLAPFHWIDAVTPPLEQRLEELTDRVVAAFSSEMPIAESQNKRRQRLIGQAIRPRAEFLGRDRELADIHGRFTAGCDALFLTGMGGIGKSEIAKAYAQRHRDRFHTVVFAPYETDLLHLIADDRAISVENLQQATASGGQGETVDAYFDRKMKTLHAVTDENTLLIIDNFDVESDEKLKDVLSLPCKLIFTTRTDFSAFGFETVKIGPLEHAEDLLTLMQRVDHTYTSDEDRAAAEKIIRLLEAHTYAVSLTAAQMKAAHIKPSKMLSMMETEGLNITTKSGFARDVGGKKSTAYEYIRALFDFPRLDETACAILRFLACMPQEGADIDLFMECCGAEDFSDISRLVDLNWVLLDEENDRIGLHMLVRELVWENIPPRVDNCAPLLSGAAAWAHNAWNKLYEENRSHSSIIFSLLESFPTPPIEWLDCFEELATFAWIMSRFELAERMELHLYRLCAEHYGTVSREAGNQALRVAAVYHNQGDYAKARPWYMKGLEVQESVDPSSAEAFTARSKVARSNAQVGDYEIAKELYSKNLPIAVHLLEEAVQSDASGEFLRKAYLRHADAHLNLGRILTALGDFDTALPYAQTAFDYFANDTVEPSLVIYARMVLVYVYHGLSEFDTAIDLAQTALEENNRYHGKERIDAMFLHEMCGDLLAQKGDYDAAIARYADALCGREKLYSADRVSLARVEEKLTDAQNRVCKERDLQGFWP